MRVLRLIHATIALAMIMTPMESIARYARLPDIVGPQSNAFIGSCATRFSEISGSAIGAQIPIPALRLGAPVRRATTSFTTGGSGTANFAEMQRRKEAGLPYEPATFDVASPAPPLVYATDIATAGSTYLYQRLPLKTDSGIYGPDALVFAQSTSPITGRIASLQLTMTRAPSPAPKVRVTIGRPTSGGCQDQVIDVYAPAMTPERIRQLFALSSCNWRRLSGCTESQWPRGRVLFVQPSDGPARYTYRWVDYDLLATARFGRSPN
jgi:hypothetical protein